MESVDLNTLTSGEAMAVGISFGMIITIAVIWYILTIVGDWKLFQKAGKPGWHSIIPILNFYDEYDLCWSGGMGLLFVVSTCVNSYITYFTPNPKSMTMSMIAAVCAVITFVLHLIQSWKLAKAFGKGVGYFLFLLFFDRIARAILGLGSSQYLGKERESQY